MLFYVNHTYYLHILGEMFFLFVWFFYIYIKNNNPYFI